MIVGRFLLFPPIHQFPKPAIFLQDIATNPGVGSRAAPGIVDQTDRNIQRLVQTTAKKVADGRKILDGLRRTGTPLTVKIVLRFLSTHSWNSDEPNIRVIGSESLQFRAIGILYRPGHIGLARANPDLSHQNIIKKEFGSFALDLHAVRAAGRNGSEDDFPVAVLIGLGLVALAENFYFDHFSGPGPAPDGVGLLLLEDHVVAEDGGEAELGITQGSGYGKY